MRGISETTRGISGLHGGLDQIPDFTLAPFFATGNGILDKRDIGQLVCVAVIENTVTLIVDILPIAIRYFRTC